MEVVTITCNSDDTREDMEKKLKGKVPKEVMKEALDDFDKFRKNKQKESNPFAEIQELISSMKWTKPLEDMTHSILDQMSSEHSSPAFEWFKKRIKNEMDEWKDIRSRFNEFIDSIKDKETKFTPPKFRVGDYAVYEWAHTLGITSYIKIYELDVTDEGYLYNEYDENDLRKPTPEEIRKYFR